MNFFFFMDIKLGKISKGILKQNLGKGKQIRLVQFKGINNHLIPLRCKMTESNETTKKNKSDQRNFGKFELKIKNEAFNFKVRKKRV